MQLLSRSPCTWSRKSAFTEILRTHKHIAKTAVSKLLRLYHMMEPPKDKFRVRKRPHQLRLACAHSSTEMPNAFQKVLSAIGLLNQASFEEFLVGFRGSCASTCGPYLKAWVHAATLADEGDCLCAVHEVMLHQLHLGFLCDHICVQLLVRWSLHFSHTVAGEGEQLELLLRL